MNDKEYWNKRYASGGNSGAGSRGNLAEYKAEVINGIINTYGIGSLLDLGCGDGYQCALYKVGVYMGYDISEQAVAMCKAKHYAMANAMFDVYIHGKLPVADMAISMDVLFHITNRKNLEEYLNDLFGCAQKVVVIYAYDYDSSDSDRFSSHYKPIKFTPIIKSQHPEWTLAQSITNQFNARKYGTILGSYSDFYVYVRDSEFR